MSKNRVYYLKVVQARVERPATQQYVAVWKDEDGVINMRSIEATSYSDAVSQGLALALGAEVRVYWASDFSRAA